jgi:hypothetical protein
MKRIMISLLLGLSPLCVKAEEATTVMDLSWDSPYALKVPGSEITHPDQGSPVLTISRVNTNTITSAKRPHPKDRARLRSSPVRCGV